LYGESGPDDLDGGLRGPEPEAGVGNQDRLDGGTENDLLWGGESSDILIGGEGSDTLKGESGNDRLFGENGNDTLHGGAGRDTLDGGFGQDGLFGGTMDARDDLFGGPDPDRILSADDNDRDREPQDALLHFVNWVRAWNDAEIEEIDKGFGWLHAMRGNPALLKTEGENMITFERIVSVGGSNVADNDSRGKIRFADSTFDVLYGRTGNGFNPYPADAVAVHEMGHNWDYEMGSWFDDNWLPLSGWEPKGDNDAAPPGKMLSGDGWWYFNSAAVFGDVLPPPTLPYGAENPREDWSVAWEAYFVRQTYTNTTIRNLYNFTGMEAKFAVLDRFFAGNF
jgi:hypothetical protein